MCIKILNKSLFTILTFLTSYTIYSDPLEKYLWKNRVLISISPNKEYKQRKIFVQEILNNLCEFNDRDLIHIDLINNYANISGGEKIFKYLKLNNINSKVFHLILIGKDGKIKEVSQNANLFKFFELIDNMPMRRNEMINNKC